MKYLGIDYGLRKVGLALGDSASRIAVPFDMIEGGADVVQRIIALASKEGIDAFVVGLPVPTTTQQNPAQWERTKVFIASLKELSGLPVEIIDEAFTSHEAKRLQRENATKAPEDALAAMVITQEFLDGRTDERRF